MPNEKPIHEIRLGAIKATTWKNDTDNGVRYNTSFARLYREENEWKSTGSFGRDDLLLLAKVADMTHSWICEQTRDERSETQGRTEFGARP